MHLPALECNPSARNVIATWNTTGDLWVESSHAPVSSILQAYPYYFLSAGITSSSMNPRAPESPRSRIGSSCGPAFPRCLTVEFFYHTFGSRYRLKRSKDERRDVTPISSCFNGCGSEESGLANRTDISQCAPAFKAVLTTNLFLDHKNYQRKWRQFPKLTCDSGAIFSIHTAQRIASIGREFNQKTMLNNFCSAYIIYCLSLVVSLLIYLI